MGRRLVRAGEFFRRMVGKPGRRSGIERRKENEHRTTARGEHGEYPHYSYDTGVSGGVGKFNIQKSGLDRRSGKDQRKK